MRHNPTWRPDPLSSSNADIKWEWFTMQQWPATRGTMIHKGGTERFWAEKFLRKTWTQWTQDETVRKAHEALLRRWII